VLTLLEIRSPLFSGRSSEIGLFAGSSNGDIFTFSIFIHEIIAELRPTVLRGHTQAITAMEEMPTKYLISASLGKSFIIWDMISGQKLHQLSDCPHSVSSIEFELGPKGSRRQLVYTGDSGGNFCAWTMPFASTAVFKRSRVPLTDPFEFHPIEELHEAYPPTKSLDAGGITTLKAMNEDGDPYDVVFIGFEDGGLP
jgi:WD40 repeat protein